MLELRALHEISFAVERVEPGEGCEFFAVLRTSSDGAPSDLDTERMRLLRWTACELGDQALWLRATDISPRRRSARALANRVLATLKR